MRIVDVSSNNHPNGQAIDWRRVADAGVEGVYVKVTEGAGYRNPWTTPDVIGALRAGLRVGPYHFARFDLNQGAEEARFFLAKAAGFAWDLPPMLDLETGSGVGWGVLGFKRDEWFSTVDPVMAGAGLYVNLDYLRNLPGGAQGRRLWLAEWTAAPSVDCWLWQYGTEPVDGAPNALDMSRLIGPLAGPTTEDQHVKLNKPIVGPPVMTPTGAGYWLIGADGGVFAFGDAWVPDANPVPNLELAAPVTGAACTSSGRGLLMTAADGGVFAIGDAVDLGSIPAL